MRVDQVARRSTDVRDWGDVRGRGAERTTRDRGGSSIVSIDLDIDRFAQPSGFVVARVTLENDATDDG